MTTIHQKARLMKAADRDARHVWPSLHDEAITYCARFGTAKGMLEGFLTLLTSDDLPEDVREKMLAFQIARTRRQLEEWK